MSIFYNNTFIKVILLKYNEYLQVFLIVNNNSNKTNIYIN